MSFTGFAFYIAVRCGFDKHLYLTSCLNAHNHNICIRLAQTGCTARKLALFIISQDRQTQVLAAIAMATTIIIDLSPAPAFACNNPSDNITEIRYFGTVRLLRPKQNKVLYVNMEYTDLLSPTAPSLVFARETCTPYMSICVN